MSGAEKQWVPLESNPAVLTSFAHALGLSRRLAFADVWSLDLIGLVPSPRYAVLLLFPLTPVLRAAADALPTADAEELGEAGPYFVEQKIGNACGTIALLHAGLNAGAEGPELEAGGFLAGFAGRTVGMTGAQRGEMLGEDEGLDEVHGKFAAQGQTAAPAAGEKVDLHFVAFVEKGGRLWMLDGRREGPVVCGPCAKGEVVEEAAKVVRERFMKADPEEQRFTIMALAMKEGE